MQQPWMPGATPPARAVPDDFSRATAVLPLRRAVIVLGVVGLLLVMGRSEAMLDSAYGLPILPGTEALIAVVEAWHAAMVSLGLPEALRELRALMSWGR